jgi:hypothetical protein
MHCSIVARAVLSGRVVPLLGAGANLCDREGTAEWAPGDGLPSGRELATFLVHEFATPTSSKDLLRVAQYVEVLVGSDPLYETLHELFGAACVPTRLHHFLAGLPEQGRRVAGGDPAQHQLIVTTNYDDGLETAFNEAGEEFDLVSYISDGSEQGKFLHRPPNGNAKLIERANEYPDLSLARRTVILKVHGAVDREQPERDSYVITEDDYIDYLTRTDVSTLLPSPLVDALRRSHILFLGHSLGDWNLRAIFHRIWKERPRRSRSWAVQRGADELDVRVWQERGVEILDVPLGEYVEALERHVRAVDLAKAAA